LRHQASVYYVCCVQTFYMTGYQRGSVWEPSHWAANLVACGIGACVQSAFAD